LFNEYQGQTVQNLAFPFNIDLANASWKGEGVEITNQKVNVPCYDRIEPQKLTLIALFELHSSSDYHVLFDKPYTSHTDPYYSYHLRCTGEDSIYGYVVPNSWAARVEVTLSKPLSFGKPYVAAMKYDGSNLSVHIFDGTSVESANETGAITIAYWNTNLHFGVFRNLNYAFNGNYKAAYVFGRPLTDEELERIFHEPYSFFLVPSYRYFSLPPSGYELARDLSWRILTRQEAQTAWALLALLTKDTSWRILNAADRDLAWRILTSITKDTSWAIATRKEQSTGWAILAELPADVAWQILTTGLLSADIAWRILARQEVQTSWAVLHLTEQSAAWRILHRLPKETSWAIQTRLTKDLQWAILNLVKQGLGWMIFNVHATDTEWVILTQLAEQVGWAVLTESEAETAWQIFSSIIPKPYRIIRLTGREMIYAPEGRTFIIRAKKREV